jgi:NTE family protein
MRRRLLTAAAAAAALPGAGRARPAARVGFALGSGALHGHAHIGIVRGCERLGLRPYAIAGTSAGAAVGALWAAGLSAAEIARIADTLDWSASPGLMPLLFGRQRNEALRQQIDRAVQGRSIEQLPLRFAAVATDALSGEPVVLDAGAVGLAVAASAAVPVLFEPVRIGSHQLIDGSLSAPVPVETARFLGADTVVAVDIAYRPYEERPRSSLDYAFQSLHIVTNALAREQTRSAEHLIKLDLHHLMHGRFDARPLIEAGEQALLEIAPALGLTRR